MKWMELRSLTHGSAWMPSPSNKHYWISSRDGATCSNNILLIMSPTGTASSSKLHVGSLSKPWQQQERHQIKRLGPVYTDTDSFVTVSFSLQLCLPFTRWWWEIVLFWKRCQKWSVFKMIGYEYRVNRGNCVVLTTIGVWHEKSRANLGGKNRSPLIKMVSNVHRSSELTFAVMNLFYSLAKSLLQLVSPCWIKIVALKGIIVSRSRNMPRPWRNSTENG